METGRLMGYLLMYIIRCRFPRPESVVDVCLLFLVLCHDLR